MRRRYVKWSLAVAAVAATAAMPSAAVAAPEQRPGPSGEQASAGIKGPLGQAGRWLTDADGRVVQLHGFNVMRRLPPFHPQPFGEADARWLADQGFNSARLGVMYEAVEPRLGVYDDQYIDRMVGLNRILNRYGFFNTIDFHQDVFSRKFNGDGFPEWANPDVPTLESIWRRVADQPFFRDADDKYFLHASLNPVERRAWDDFWTNRRLPNGRGLQDEFIRAWGRVAKAFTAAQDKLLGYTPLNEPLSGNCVLPLCNHIEEQRVPFYKRWLKELRKVDRSNLALLENEIWFAGGEGHSDEENAEYVTRKVSDRNIGIERHYYAGGAAQEPQYDTAVRLAQKTGHPFVVNEFGAGFGPPEKFARDADFAGARFTSWMWWSYYAEGAICCSDSGFVEDDALPVSDANVKPGLADALIVPYAQAIAGTPESSSFDRAGKTMRLRYTTRPVGRRLAGDARTVIFVPRRQYPTGYTVTASGARVVSRPTAPWVELVNERGTDAVTVEIAPAADSHVELPSEALGQGR